MNQEYEYSFQVKDVNEFIQYCIDHNYEKVESYHQIRTLFKNGGKIMARITKNTYDNQTVELLNFKDDNLNDETLTISPAMKVVAIEGEKEKVDSVYQELQDIIEANKVI